MVGRSWGTRGGGLGALAAMAGAVAVLGACDGGPSGLDRSPAEVIPRGGDAQTAPVGTAVDVPPSALVVNAGGRPVPGVTVLFSVVGGGGRLVDSVTVTDEEGLAEVGAWILGTTPGVNELRVVVPGAPELDPAAVLATAVTGAPVGLELVGVTDSVGVAGGQASPLPSVRVVDEFGNPAEGVTVHFRVTAGGGQVEPSQVATNAQGLARPERWTLGATAGLNELQAILPGVDTVVFRVRGGPAGAGSLLHVAGDDQTAPAGSAVPVAPAVRAVDAFGNPRPGVTVRFEVETGEGSVAPSSAVTDAQGLARADRWTLGPVEGANVLLASADGDTVVFRATATDTVDIDLQKVGGDLQAGSVGESLPEQPRVRLTRASGDPIANYPIVFEVETGGGSVSADTVRTDASGVAGVDWVLGSKAGEQLLSAQADGWDRVVFTATAVAGAVDDLLALVGQEQDGPEGGALPAAPVVRVVDAFGNPVAGVQVRFTVQQGGGSVQRTSAVTDATGRASAGVWTLGAAGPQQLLASVPGGPSVTFTATAVRPGSFDVTVRYVSSVAPEQREAIERSVARWREVVVGDLASVRMSVPADQCVEGQPALNETVDDLLIFVRIKNIDGAGQVLGSAGPCYLRSGGGLPVVGVVNLDSADLAVLSDRGIMESVVLHEIGHVMGIGSLWKSMALLSGAGTDDPLFLGPAAGQAFETLGGGGFGEDVPVENTGGAGTRDSHWRETILGPELMTGYVGRAPNPLSLLTVASLADMGYVVDLSAADGFVVPGAVAGSVAAAVASGEILPLREVPLPRAPFVVTADGTVEGAARAGVGR